jgi:hypothetical protein
MVNHDEEFEHSWCGFRIDFLSETEHDTVSHFVTNHLTNVTLLIKIKGRPALPANIMDGQVEIEGETDVDRQGGIRIIALETTHWEPDPNATPEDVPYVDIERIDIY